MSPAERPLAQRVVAALQAADALDRAARRIRNPRLAEILRERADARRQTVRWAREHRAGRAPCPDPACEVVFRLGYRQGTPQDRAKTAARGAGQL